MADLCRSGSAISNPITVVPALLSGRARRTNMPTATQDFNHRLQKNEQYPELVYRKIPILALGASLSFFLSLTFTLCVLFDLWLPAYAMNAVWAGLLPGFTWISWSSFLLGFAETFAFGWYIALFFAPLFNFFAARSR